MEQHPEPCLLGKGRLSLEGTELLLIAYHSHFLSAVILALTPGFGPPGNTVHLYCERRPVQSFFRQQRDMGIFVQKQLISLLVTVHSKCFIWPSSIANENNQKEYEELEGR